MGIKKLLKHSIRTAIIASSFSKNYLKLSEEEVNSLFISAIYHDIGKLFIPNEILYKEDKLTKEEFEIIKEHPTYSFNLLSYSKKFNDNILRAVKEHHERIDGKGYPLGLMRDEISYISKVLSICDAYEAMTTDRCYQKRKNREEAIIEIKNGLDAQFDRELGLFFIDFISKEEEFLFNDINYNYIPLINYVG